MATIPEIQAALDVLKNNGTDDVTILHATTEYPTRTADINLNAMKTLQHHFDGYQIGLSDHSLGYAVAIGAAALGATTIEKHFTIDNTLPGPDQKASATPDVLSALVSGVRTIEEAMGSADKKAVEVEIFNKIVARKSIVARRDIKRGEVFTEENITVKRPGNGISPMRWYDVLGKEAQRDFKYDDLIVDERFEWQE